MKWIRIIRANEWWEYKLPSMLAIGYATILNAGGGLMATAGFLCFLLLSVIAGAIYVSLVNDLTDVEEDRASGKHNRLAGLQPGARKLMVMASLLPGVVCVCFLLPDVLPVVFYALAWISFSLYSLRPVRLKNRGFAGVLADAAGAHLFPNLFMVAAIQLHLTHTVAPIWLVMVGVWSLMCGLRGILWHQFHDRDNDLKIGLNTFATGQTAAGFGKTALLILLTEAAVLFFMLIYTRMWLPLAALSLYFFMVAGYAKVYGLAIIAIIPPRDQPWHMVLVSYYQFLFPVSLILTAAIFRPADGLLLLAHAVLFPLSARHTIIDLLYFGRALLGRKKLVN